MTRAYVGLGANLGDAQGTIRQAMDQLDALPNTRIGARRSPPASSSRR